MNLDDLFTALVLIVAFYLVFFVGKLVNDVVKVAQQQGMRKVGFVTTPPKKNI